MENPGASSAPVAQQDPLDRSDPPELYDQMLVLFQRIRQHVREQAAAEDLSLLQVRALRVLDRVPLSSRALAEELQLDASNVTGVLDHLEHRGLLQRLVQPNDRRVKLLVVTEAGRALSKVLHARLVASNPFADCLSPADQRELSRLLQLMLQHRATEPS